MNIAWSLITGVLLLGFLAMGVLYFLKRRKGKGYLAVSATSAIVAIWVSYAALLSVNWPAAFVAFILRNNPDKIAAATQPSVISVVAALPIAAGACYLIYKLAMAELAGNRLPLNASAREVEEPGRTVGLLELAGAHARYRLSGRLDEPLANPGEDPFILPTIPRQTEWPMLAADLLVQVETDLQRETFRLSDERKFFSLQAMSIQEPAHSQTWLVYPIHSESEIKMAVTDLRARFRSSLALDLRLIVCVRVDRTLDYLEEADGGPAVRILSLGALTEMTLDLREYATSLIRRFEQKIVPGTTFTLLDSFVPLKAKPVSPGDRLSGAEPEGGDGDGRDVLDLLHSWSREPGVDHLSIIGEFGQGKSTVLLAYCAQWARQWLSGERGDRIPLLIELRGKSPRRQSPDRFLAEWGDRYGLRGNALLSLIQGGRATLIFEGFDEVQDAGLRFDRFEQFKSLWEFSYPGSKIVFTGRPNFFLDTDEREKLLRSSEVARDAGLENTQILSLSFLDEKGIARALRAYPRRIRNEILDVCRRDSAFFNVARRPSMLPVIGNQWERIKTELSIRGGITSAAIIGYFIDFLYTRKEADPERLGEYKLLHRKVRHYFTQRVAWKMTTLRSRNTIDVNNFVRAIEEAYLDLDAEFRFDAGADPEIASSIARLHEMFKSRPHAETMAYIAGDVRSNGLLVPDPAGGRDNLYFPHKQYFEFIIGEVLVSAINRKGRAKTWAQRLPELDLVRGVMFEPVSLFFAAGLMEPNRLEKGEATVWSKLQGEFMGAAATLAVTLALTLRPKRRYSGLQRTIILNAPLRWRGLILARRNEESRRTRGVFSLIALSSMIIGVLPAVLSLTLFRSSEGSTEIAFPFMVLGVVFAMGFALSSVMPVVGFFTKDVCFLYMEVYRCGRVSRVNRDFGRKAHAAFICLLKTCLPVGAVDLPTSLVEESLAVLGIRSTDIASLLSNGQSA